VEASKLALKRDSHVVSSPSLEGAAMEVRSPHSTRETDTSAIVQRVRAILDDEIACGALANIAASTRKQSDHPFGVHLPEVTRRLAAEFGGLLETVVDLLAPLPRSTLVRPAADQDPPPGVPHIVEPVAVLRARRSVPPGGTAEIRTTLQNDDPASLDVGFVWSDLVGEPRGRIEASRLRLRPARVRVPPGASADFTIGLHVPVDATPGLYHALLQAGERTGLCALLMFPVGFDAEQEAPVAR
jgi:hypothetical protein